jgi:hypothetical protein
MDPGFRRDDELRVARLLFSRIYPRRGDVLPILLGIALVGGFIVLASLGRWHVLPNWGCMWPGKGEPVCFQESPEKPVKPDQTPRGAGVDLTGGFSILQRIMTKPRNELRLTILAS